MYINVSGGENLDTCILNLINGSGDNNITMIVSGTYCYLNVTDLGEDDQYFRVYGNDTEGNMNVTEDRQISTQSPIPLLDFVSPTLANNSITGNNWIYINVSSDLALDECLLDWPSTGNESMTVSGSYCYIDKTSLSDSAYYFRVWGNTSTSAMNSTEFREITVQTGTAECTGTDLSSCNDCDVSQAKVTILAPPGGGSIGPYDMSFDSQTGTCADGDNPRYENWTYDLGYTFCPVEGLYNASVSMYAEGDTWIWESSDSNWTMYTVTYDNEQEWCECGNYNWMTRSNDFEKNLPDSQVEDWANMTGNVLLMHFDESLFEDEFDGSTFGSEWLETVQRGDIYLTSEKARIELPGNGSNFFNDLRYNPNIVGDFDIKVDFENLVFPAPSSGINYLPLIVQAAGTPGANQFVIRMYRNSATWRYQYYWYDDGTVLQASTTITDDTSGKFRIRRIGTNLSIFYWDNTLEEWNEVLTNKSAWTHDITNIYIRLQSWDSAANGISVDFDNFIIRNATNAEDTSGNGNNGTLGNDTLTTLPGWVDGKLDYSMQFDESKNNFISLGASTDLLRNVESSSAAAWIKIYDTGTAMQVLEITKGDNKNSRFEINILSDGRVRVGGRSNDTESFQSKSTVETLESGIWYHVVGVMNYSADDIKV